MSADEVAGVPSVSDTARLVAKQVFDDSVKCAKTLQEVLKDLTGEELPWDPFLNVVVECQAILLNYVDRVAFTFLHEERRDEFMGTVWDNLMAADIPFWDVSSPEEVDHVGEGLADFLNEKSHAYGSVKHFLPAGEEDDAAILEFGREVVVALGRAGDFDLAAQALDCLAEILEESGVVDAVKLLAAREAGAAEDADSD